MVTRYMGRLILSSALSLLAAVKSGLGTAIDKLGAWLAFWEDESPYFGKGKEVLKVLSYELD